MILYFGEGDAAAVDADIELIAGFEVAVFQFGLGNDYRVLI